MWWRKENLHNAANTAYLGSCDPNTVLYSVQRSFVVDPGTGALAMANGSCPWANFNNESDPSSVVVSTGDCAAPNGQWRYRSIGDIVFGGGTGSVDGAGGTGGAAADGGSSTARGSAGGATSAPGSQTGAGGGWGGAWRPTFSMAS